jgi:hypothetical protein
MPKEFEGQMDLIVSRTAWRYFAYPDIALRNTVQALSEGGMADIWFEATRSVLRGTEEGRAELNDRIRNVVKWIKDQEEQGLIKTNIDQILDGAHADELDSDFDGWIKIIKSKKD